MNKYRCDGLGADRTNKCWWLPEVVKDWRASSECMNMDHWSLLCWKLFGPGLESSAESSLLCFKVSFEVLMSQRNQFCLMTFYISRFFVLVTEIDFACDVKEHKPSLHIIAQPRALVLPRNGRPANFWASEIPMLKYLGTVLIKTQLVFNLCGTWL